VPALDDLIQSALTDAGGSRQILGRGYARRTNLSGGAVAGGSDGMVILDEPMAQLDVRGGQRFSIAFSPLPATPLRF